MISNDELKKDLNVGFEFDSPTQINIDQKAYKNGAKTALRMRYMAEVEVLRKELGGLEQVRERLQLSRRKMCQKLLVDPSAWTRWSKDESKVPPHIWKMLSFITQDSSGRISRLEKEALSKKVEDLESSFSIQLDLVKKLFLFSFLFVAGLILAVYLK
ncbi:hypothetical protein GW916_06965 [bacterium]|nr:hypothetical protein [bacterium]